MFPINLQGDDPAAEGACRLPAVNVRGRSLLTCREMILLQKQPAGSQHGVLEDVPY